MSLHQRTSAAEQSGDPVETADHQTTEPQEDREQKVDRTAELAKGPPGIPPAFVWWVLGAALFLTVGGLIGEHLFSSAGLNPTATTTPTSLASPTRPQAAPVPAPSGPDIPITAPLPSFMGLSTPTPVPAPTFTLTDQNGQAVSIPLQQDRVVVLSFFDSPCDDICPVLAQEIEQADHDLGAQAADVEFFSVNTDPRALAESSEGPVLQGTGLAALSNWRMLTGPLATLNAVWKEYGVSVSVDTKTGLEAHSDVLDFIDPQGFLRDRATPFADESSTGLFSLPAESVDRWSQGIATYAHQLIGQ
jgi:cytochrome oxidase Cu insertion factor (SCO1/SenC/PrrC family)